MKKATPIGKKVKELREQLESGATQKELAHTVCISERMLRNIENVNAEIPINVLNRLAKALNVNRRELAFGLDGPQLVPQTDDAIGTAISRIFEQDRIIPRYDEDFAHSISDEGELFSEANNSHDVECLIKTQLNEETEKYAQELFSILTSLSWTKRSILEKVEALEEINFRRRIRQLIVLLKGNDIWIYRTSVYRRLPERHSLEPDDEPCSHESRLYVVLGPPGEYGETSIEVRVDNGQPFLLKGSTWAQEKTGG
jgi:transcriptional regulator with XRE-family HTH domain